MIEPWDHPTWDRAGRVHDWRNYVPEEIRDMWFTFTQIQRKALYETFAKLAANEEWD